MSQVFISNINPIYFPNLQSEFGKEGKTMEQAESDCNTTLTDFVQSWVHTDSINFQAENLNQLTNLSVSVLDQSGTETPITGTASSSKPATVFNFEIPLFLYKGIKIQVIIRQVFLISGLINELDRTPWMNVIDGSDEAKTRNLVKFEYYGLPSLSRTQGVYYHYNSVPEIVHQIRIRGVVLVAQPDMNTDVFLDSTNTIQNNVAVIEDVLEMRVPFIPLWLYKKMCYIASSANLKMDEANVIFNGAPTRGQRMVGKWLFECDISLKLSDASLYSY